MPRRDLVARARHRHGRGRPRRSRSSRRSPSHAGSSGSAARATSWARSRRGASSRSSAPTCSSPRSSPGGCATARSRRRVIPRNPLDVLAQQIVAVCADEEISVDELHELVRRRRTRSPTSRASSSRTCSTCSPAATRPTSSPSCGRASSGTGPRASSAAAPARAGSRSRTRARSPTAGLFTVQLVDGGGRVGELDEEMVYEARAGQTFLLGASTWRIEEITRDRVLVSPAPGVPGAVPFWKGEGVGRPVRARRGDRPGLARARLAAPTSRRVERLAGDYSPRRAGCAQPARRSCASRKAPTGAVPSDRTRRRRAVPRRDRRLARLHPDAVRRPGARAVGARARGTAARVARPRGAVDLVGRRHRAAPAGRGRAAAARGAARSRPTRSRSSSSQEVGQSALFGSRFRENAARALLIPRRRPAQRTPLWQQRLKAQSLLQVARRYPAFPIVLETYRECLQDVFDLPGAHAAAAGHRDAPGRRRRRRDAVGVAVRRPRSSSTTSRRTCTRTTRRRPSGGRRRCRSTATCCASCSARRSCATCSIRGAVDEVEAQLARGAADS